MIPIRAIERSAERDAAMEALLPLVPFTGWTVAGLQEAAGADADLLFPGGPAEIVEAYSDLADRRMSEAAARTIVASDSLTRRVRQVIALRLQQAEPERDAVRRGLAVLALPGSAAAAARVTARTVDAIWQAAGDHSTGFSHYSKRGILAGIYGATLLYWLGDMSGGENTLAFLDRRLREVGRIGKLRARLGGMRRAA